MLPTQEWAAEPMPKLKPAADKMAPAMLSVVNTIMGLSELGKCAAG